MVPYEIQPWSLSIRQTYLGRSCHGKQSNEESHGTRRDEIGRDGTGRRDDVPVSSFFQRRRIGSILSRCDGEKNPSRPDGEISAIFHGNRRQNERHSPSTERESPSNLKGTWVYLLMCGIGELLFRGWLLPQAILR